MKAAVTFLAVMACAMASPFPMAHEVNLSPVDWSKITNKNVYVEALPDAPDIPAARVIGGGIVTANSSPWQGYIIISSRSFCGCSVISNTWILSAAHCTVGATTLQVVLGAHNRQLNEATQLVFFATSLVNHPNYNNNGIYANDVSVFRGSGAFSLTSAIQSISLAPANSGNFAGNTALLTGWGLTNAGSQPAQLHGVNLVVLTNAACAQVFGNAAIVDTTICTQGATGNTAVGACSGDSGGPLSVNRVQVGIVSFGDVSCVSGRPTAFARVSSFRNWIQQNSGV